jgi:hypothetical protein
VRIGHVAQLHCVVTDRPPPARFEAACRAAGTRLELAGQPEPGTRSETENLETETP